ncbi:hypothetical protein LINGRAHAP2_LOCUS9253, partial [Linum grandiflorum]
AERIFEAREPAYEVLTHEFLSTLCVNLAVPADEPMLRFRLGGEDTTLTQDEIGVACGFYTGEDLSQDWYRALVTDMSLLDMSFIWGVLVGDGSGWTASVSKATSFRCKAYRYLHRVLSESISGRTESMGDVLSS